MRVFDRDGVRVRRHGPYLHGAVYSGHRHFTDHQTFVHEGTRLQIEYRIRPTDQVPLRTDDVEGPARVLIAAGLFHTITILSDEGWWDCEFAIPPEGSPLARVFADEMID